MYTTTPKYEIDRQGYPVLRIIVSDEIGNTLQSETQRLPDDLATTKERQEYIDMACAYDVQRVKQKIVDQQAIVSRAAEAQATIELWTKEHSEAKAEDALPALPAPVDKDINPADDQPVKV